MVIEFEPGVEMDITALQVFCSACKTADGRGETVYHIANRFPRRCIDLAVAAGSERHDHCKNNNPSCFRQFGGRYKWEN